MKKALSALLVCSMLLPITLFASSASAIDTVSVDSSATIDVTGDVYADLIDAGLVDPNFLPQLKVNLNWFLPLNW